MKIKTLLLILLVVFSIKPEKTMADSEINFRITSFEDKGYLLNYEIIQGENLNEMFENLGFDIDGSFTGSEFNILLKNRKLEERQIYYIESDKFEKIEVPVFSFENYIILSNTIDASFNTNGEFLKDLIGFNYQPLEPKILKAKIPKDSSIYIPNIFTNITRPNFGGLVKNLNYFDFLPFIIGNDFKRYEAEFTSLLLNESFSVNVYNQDSKEFTISLNIALETTPIKIKATWNKETGVLLSLSLHFIYENKSSVFIISLKKYEEILSPLTVPQKSYFITNSLADYAVYDNDYSTEQRLEEWKIWFVQLNQSIGLKYLLSNEGLDFTTKMLVYNNSTHNYQSSTPIHDSWIAFLPPALIPIWGDYIGAVKLIQGIWEQFEEELNGFKFILSGITDSLYSIESVDLHLEYQFNEGLHELLWSGALHYTVNNTRTVIPSFVVTDISFETQGWLAYTQKGMLEGFSFYYKEFYHTFLQDYSNLSIITTYDNYYYEYLLESKPENMTRPIFTEVKKTTFTTPIMQIIFYSVIVYAYIKKNKKKREKNEYQ